MYDRDLCYKSKFACLKEGQYFCTPNKYDVPRSVLAYIEWTRSSAFPGDIHKTLVANSNFLIRCHSKYAFHLLL